MNKTKKKAILYRRASTDSLKQEHSLDRQAQQILQFAESHNYEVIDTFEEYASAYKSNNRPQFKAALRMLKDDEDLILIVLDLTRLERSLEGYGDWKNHLQRIRFASLGNKAIEPLVAELLLVVAGNESRVLSSRIRSGIEAKKNREGMNFVWGFGVAGQNDSGRVKAQINSIKSRAETARDTANKIVSYVNYLVSIGVNHRKDQCVALEENRIRTSRGNKVTPQAITNAFRHVNSTAEVATM
jgi:DNA invertase Pin-like site-specific DNA recombinase